MALLVFRDMPGISGYTPSLLLFGRRLQTRVPKLEEAPISALPSKKDLKRKDKVARSRQAKHSIRQHRIQRLRPLSVGEEAWVNDVNCATMVPSSANRPHTGDAVGRYLAQSPTLGTVR